MFTEESDMSKDQSQTMKEIINRVEGVNLKENKKSSLKFRMHMTKKMSDAPLEMLDLSARPYNSLKRAGYSTIGELVDALAKGVNLNGIKNCGTTSVREIKEKLFLFQYNSLPANRQDAYITEVILMNV